jgi:hypothetical protein
MDEIELTRLPAEAQAMFSRRTMVGRVAMPAAPGDAVSRVSCAPGGAETLERA